MAGGSPPDFVGVGTNKSGTTWWHRLIGLHPCVHVDPARPKELHHFDPFWERRFTDDDVRAYHARFERPDGLLAGEWTPRYAADPWVAPLLQRAAPEAVWLFLVRDPWERLVSELRAELGRPLRAARGRLVDLALARSRYGEQLARLVEVHGRDRVLVLQYERCVADPGAELARTHAALGLDHVRPDPVELRRPVNPGDGPVPVLGDELRDGVRSALAADLDRFCELAGADVDLGRWPSVV